MEKIIHKSANRGFADHGWLKASHSFSFANFYDENKIHFGKLRVLNDDIVAPSRGFGMHPHQDMEIITIPLSGALKHADNMGNEAVITTGEVQVMSAGTGVLHSEHNASDTKPVNLFQIWIFTDKKGHTPRYDQKKFSTDDRNGKWQLMVSPDGKNSSLIIHQNAFISAIDAGENDETTYQLQSAGNGVYFMVTEGAVIIEETELGKRDAAGFWSFIEPLKVRFKQQTSLLAIEVPVN
jgi:redox-sensitive bicupin YhaK (pirin superfamily)